MPATVGIIQGLQNIPLGLLTNSLDLDGPYAAGNHTLTQWNDGGVIRNVSDTFGVIVQINGAIAPKLGLQVGYSDGVAVDLDTFDQRITQIAIQHQLVTGAWVADQVVDVFYAPFLMRWAEDLPGRVGLYVSPTWHVDLLYLKTI
jgi:hypothetical protein